MSGVLLWSSIFLSVCAWEWLLPFYSLTNLPAGGGLLALGFWSLAAALLVAGWKTVKDGEQQESRSKTGGRILLISALVFLAILVVQGLTVVFYSYVAATHRHMSFLLYPLYWVLCLLGYSCALEAGVLNVWNSQYLVPFSANSEKLALLPTLLLVGAVGVMQILSSKRPSGVRLMAAGCVVVVAWLLRLVLLVSLLLEYDDPFQPPPFAVAIFSDRVLTAMYLLLLTVALGTLLRHRPHLLLEGVQKPRILSPPWVAGASLAAGVFCLTGALLFQDSGRIKDGPILFDDVHSRMWEKTEGRMGKYTFGGLPAYSYTSLFYLLSHHWDVEINSTRRLDQLDLSKYSVLVLKTPSVKYSAEEIESIRNYLEGGGGVFLLGDHTNLLGMNAFLNEISGKYGIRFNYDSSNRFSDGYFSEYRPSFGGLHPVVAGIGYFRFLTSCTLDAPLLCERVMICGDVFSDKIDYSKPSFFGDSIVEPDDDFGLAVLGAARKVGKGRLLLFAESTVFSNFCLFIDGHDRFFLNAINFLQRQNHWGYALNWLFAGGAGVLILLAFFRSRGRLKSLALWASLFLLLGTGVGGKFWGTLNRVHYALPPPRCPQTRVAFLDRHTEFYLPPALGTPVIPFDVSFDSFFVSMQRLGLFPFRSRSLEECEEASAIVIINPVEEFSPAELKRLCDYVKAGGNLFVTDTIYNKKPHLGRLLSPFGVDVRRTTRQIELPDPVTRAWELPRDGGDGKGSRDGGESPGILKFLCKQYGEGVIAVAVDSQFFCRSFLGSSLDKEERNRRRVYDLIYEIFEKNFELKPRMDY